MQVVFWVLMGIILIFCITAFTGAPFVPSRNKDLQEVFAKLYPIKKSDYLVDLGSGDGKVLKAANAYGARALGVEINPFLYAYSKLRFWSNPHIQTKYGDFFHMQFPTEVTVFYVFGDGRDIERMAKIVQKQANLARHDVYMISHAFDLANKKPVKQLNAYYLYKFKEEK